MTLFLVDPLLDNTNSYSYSYYKRTKSERKVLFFRILRFIDLNIIVYDLIEDTQTQVTRIIQSLRSRWSLHKRLEKSVKPEIVNLYNLWVLRHKIREVKVFVNNVQWSDQMM